MEEYNIDKEYAVFSKTDSKGTQIKYHKDGYWYKIDNVGKEGYAENIVSLLLSCSNTKSYVSYEQCFINGLSGCRSKDFVAESETFLSFQKLYQNYVGGNLADKIAIISTPEERFAFLVDFIKSATGLDCARYLQDTLALDMIIRNPDRHFNNLGVIYCSDGSFREAPIFDNGQGLFQNYTICPPNLSIEQKEKNTVGATISGNFEMQFLAAGKHLKINYEKFKRKTIKLAQTSELGYLFAQLEKYQKLFRMRDEREYKQ